MLNDVRLPSSKYLSLDLFDTLLIRKYPEPVIFEKAFLSLESTLICGLDVEEFVEYRQKAVIIARQKLNKIEVSIHQIYQYLVVPEYDRENLLKAELTEHAKALVLNHDLLNELKGKFDAESFNPLQIAFISDMYLTKSQILTILSEFDSWLAQFPIFVSSEYDKTKRLGDLFPFVKDQLGWEFSSWVHVGDDRLADVIKPEEYGITTGFINYYSEYDLLLKKENEQLKMPVEYESDRKVASLKGDCNSFKLGAMVFGPILSAFADWVIDKALAVGAQQILSISREGICFDHVIRQKLQMREIDSVNSQVFYASRRSVLLASVDTERDKWLETLFIEIIDLGNISVSEFYEIIKLSLPSKLISEKHVMSQSWSKRSLDSISLQQFLLNDVRLKKQLIVQNVALAKNSFDGYLAPISGIENCITLDFGGYLKRTYYFTRQSEVTGF
jgi:predicted HAD superfamily hydrolase